MNRRVSEGLFDALILLGVGLAQTSSLFGIGVDRFPTLLVGVVLLAIGVATLVPERRRIPAAIAGLLGLMLAGAIVPIYAARAVRPTATGWVTVVLAGVVLLLVFAILRLTAFSPRPTRTA